MYSIRRYKYIVANGVNISKQVTAAYGLKMCGPMLQKGHLGKLFIEQKNASGKS